MIYVIYGSQTGNSEEIAKRIYKETKENFPSEKVELFVMNKFLTTIQSIPDTKERKFIIIAVCSTTGAGDAPNNCDNFLRWIKRKTHASDTLSNVEYTILGLGDSNYTKYQSVPRQIDDCLSKIGATKFYPRGEADDAYGLEIVVEPWIDALYPILNKTITAQGKLKNQTFIENIPTTTESYIQISKEEKINLEESEKKVSNVKILEKSLISGVKSEKEIYSLKILPIDKRDVNFLNYEPGSHILILPIENEEKLKKINLVLNISDKILLIGKSNHFKVYSDFYEKYPHFKNILNKGYITTEEALKYIIDFSSVLKKSQVATIKSLINEKIENKEIINKFDVLFSKYTEMILKNRISLYDIIYSLSLYKIKLNLNLLEVIELFPIKYPRSYSLLSYANDKDKNLTPLEIVFSVVKDRIKRNFNNINLLGLKSGEYFYKGQSSNYLKETSVSDELIICDFSNCFKFPIDDFVNNRKTITYLCSGTGITPLLSFLKKLLQIKDNVNSESIGELIIFTGFRSASKERNEAVYEDFIYDTINILNKTWAKKVISYYRCCSNCSENEEEEVGIWRNCRINTSYVQDLIIEHEDIVRENLINKKGYLMICGDIQKLYDECINNIKTILMSKERLSRQNSEKFIEEMKFENRLIIEKWL